MLTDCGTIARTSDKLLALIRAEPLMYALLLVPLVRSQPLPRRVDAAFDLADTVEAALDSIGDVAKFLSSTPGELQNLRHAYFIEWTETWQDQRRQRA